MLVEWRVLLILDTFRLPSGSQILNRSPTPPEARPQSPLIHQVTPVHTSPMTSGPMPSGNSDLLDTQECSPALESRPACDFPQWYKTPGLSSLRIIIWPLV